MEIGFALTSATARNRSNVLISEGSRVKDLKPDSPAGVVEETMLLESQDFQLLDLKRAQISGS